MTVRELPMLILDEDEARLRLPGDRTVPLGTVEGERRPLVELNTVVEERWLPESPVVEIRGDTVVAVGPGTTTIEARAEVAFPDTLTVTVEPDGPTVFFLTDVGPYDSGAPLDFRGWGLDRSSVGAVTLGGAEATVLFRDSATLRVSVPEQSPSACVGSARRKVEIPGVLLLQGSSIPLVRSDELVLAPGAPVALQPGSCILFGYHFSMGLFRHLAQRWMDATGGSSTEAVREIFAGSTLGWNPHAVFVAGDGDRSFDMPAGGVAWIALADPDRLGATLRLPEDPRWAWRLVRVR